MAITQDMVDALKQKYKTIEDVQSSDTYKKA
jgi:hypothetical protein